MSIAGYSVAISGMKVSERGLSIAGHNISNISTVGYSKQQLIVNDARYTNMPGVGQLGLGVDVDELRQLRDSFLDENYRKENGNLSYWDVKNTNLKEIQTILNEPLGDGLQSTMNGFWSGWQELQKAPDNLTTRALLRQKATVLVNTFNNIGNQLSKVQDDINKQVSADVDKINDIADQIVDLNLKIKENELYGDHANDYRDQRNELLDELSKIVDISSTETSDDFVNVSIGGRTLIFGTTIHKLTVGENVPGSSYLSPVWSDNGDLVSIKSGELKGYLEVRGENAKGGLSDPTNGSPDGVVNIPDSQTIPSIKEKLNELIYTIATKVNEVHEAGYGMDNPPTTGTSFFTLIDPAKPFEMGNIQINPALSNLSLIAAATTNATGDGTNAQKIIDLQNQKLLGPTSDPLTFNEFYRDTISNLGVVAQEAQTMNDNQTTLVDSISNKRALISGVSLDEEMADILKYQHAYQANARMLNTLDSMLDKVINEMVK